MKKTRIFNILTVILMMSVVFYACEKDNPGDKISDDEVAFVEDDALADALFGDVFDAVDNAEKIVDNQIFNEGAKSQVIVGDSCPAITVDFPDTTHWPKVITIDYGSSGCEGFYGQTRKGKIIITVTDRYRIPGSQKTVTLVDYYINDIHVEGIKTITNNGKNNNGNLSYTVELVGGKITIPNETNEVVIEREFTRTREWISGAETLNRWDDVYYITGSATGINFRGVSYTRTILTPLEWAASCRFMKSGSIQSVVGENSPVILDYGNGECDNEATLTKDGETVTILLKYRRPRKP